MFLSVFDNFKIGVGPSSSHTMGPMLAATRFLGALRDGRDRVPGSGDAARLEASLHGSLAFTGKGHATDRAVILGLLGFVPDTLDPAEAERRLAALAASGRIDVPGVGQLACDPAKDVVFDYGPPLAGHANGLVLRAFDVAGNLHLAETYYSIGGGFVLTERELQGATLKGDDANQVRPALFLRHRGRDARDGRWLRPFHCRDEACQRHRRRPWSARCRPRPPLAGNRWLHRSRPRH